jgi:hypothetical protein
MLHYCWPSKIRNLIEQLKNEGNLNEKAVACLRRRTQVRIMMFPVVAFVFYICGNASAESVMLALLILALIPAFLWIDAWLIFQWNMGSYAYGERFEIEVTAAGNSMYGSQRVRFIHPTSGKAHTMLIGEAVRLKKLDFPKSGDRIFVYQDVAEKYKAMPDLPYMKRSFSLRSDIL